MGILVSNNKNPDLLADVVSIDEGHEVVGEGHGVADNERRVLDRRVFRVMTKKFYEVVLTNERPIRGQY